MDLLWAWLRCLMLGEVGRCWGEELRVDRLSKLLDLCRRERTSFLA